MCSTCRRRSAGVGLGVSRRADRALQPDRIWRKACCRTYRGANPLALLCLDLDGFKPVNDSLGHQAGDALLKAVADRLRGCLHDADCVGRIGGDEFAIVLSSTKSRADVVAVAERITDVISMPFTVEHQEVKIGCSVGIAFASRSDSDPSVMFRSA